jgi:hypothetical protein
VTITQKRVLINPSAFIFPGTTGWKEFKKEKHFMPKKGGNVYEKAI